MIVDLAMGLAAVLIGTALLLRCRSIVGLMKEGDDRWRGHPVFSRFEPSDGPLATDEGRVWALRAWLVFWSAGFVFVGTGLLGRALLVAL